MKARGTRSHHSTYIARLIFGLSVQKYQGNQDCSNRHHEHSNYDVHSVDRY